MQTVEPVEEIKAHIEAFYQGHQGKFAKAIGFSPAYISAVVTKKAPPSDRLLESMGLARVVVRAPDPVEPLLVTDAELSVRTSNTSRSVYGPEFLLVDLVRKTDEELKADGFMRKSIKEIREIAWSVQS